MRRRRFLGLVGGAAAGSAAGGAAGRFFAGMLSSADSPYFPPRGPESYVLSVCDLCPGGCGVRARRIGERVVKLEGNPRHPVNGGRLCPKGQAALQLLHHPDRPAGPLRRVGPRGALRSFEPVSWEAALDEIAKRLAALRTERRPEALALLAGGSNAVALRLASRFVHAFGSPNDVSFERGDEAATLAVHLTQGVRAAPVYDFQTAEYLISLGGALLEASSSPVYSARAYGEFRQGRAARRGKLVQIEPRLSITAACADEWIAVRPGTEGVFGLGLAAAIVSEGLYKKDFVAQRTTGFEDGAAGPGLRTLLERHYPLERVAAETGVPVNTILRVAREFAGAHNALAVGSRRGPLLPGRLFDHLAAHVLNALVGNVDAAGGLLVPEPAPLPAWPEPARDAAVEAGLGKPRLDGTEGPRSPLISSDPERLAEAILAEKPYALEALVLYRADPLFASAAPERFAAALAKTPLVVSIAALPDDSALHADFILPEAHFLERWDLHTTPSGVAYPLVSLAPPALARPLHDARHAGDVFLALARRLGGGVAAALPWPDVPALLRADMDGLYAARRGAVMGSAFDAAWVRMMEGAGWWAPGYRSAEELWSRAQERGGWWDPFYDHGDWERVLATPSGRYQFRADLLEPAASRTATPRLPEGAVEDVALPLVLFEPLAVAGGVGAELPFLQGILDPGHEARWETWAEIHPETAAKLRVEPGNWVRLRSPQGEIRVRARVSPRVVPDAVAVPVGLGKRGGGRWAAGVGANPLKLLVPARDPLSGLPDFGATTVTVARVAGPAPAQERG